jgi:hypothetical protein
LLELIVAVLPESLSRLSKARLNLYMGVKNLERA